MRRYRDWEPPDGPLEPSDPLGSEAWWIVFCLVLLALGLLGLLA